MFTPTNVTKLSQGTRWANDERPNGDRGTEDGEVPGANQVNNDIGRNYQAHADTIADGLPAHPSTGVAGDSGGQDPRGGPGRQSSHGDRHDGRSSRPDRGPDPDREGPDSEPRHCHDRESP